MTAPVIDYSTFEINELKRMKESIEHSIFQNAGGISYWRKEIKRIDEALNTKAAQPEPQPEVAQP